MKTVAVLLSAYNGTRYIEEQIDSVLAQEEVDVTIFVRDDGSKDGTVDFLNTRYKDDPRVVVKPEIKLDNPDPAAFAVNTNGTDRNVIAVYPCDARGAAPCRFKR